MPTSTGSAVWDKLTQHKHFNGLKNATVAFLVFILLLSVILIGVGAGGIQTLSGFDTVLKVTVPAGVIVLGIFLLISTILGLVGIYQKNAKVFAAYLFILFILIICQLGVGGGAYTWSNQIPSQIQYAWRNSLTDNDRNSVQFAFQCCGWYNNTDAEGSNCNSTRIVGTSYMSGTTQTTMSPTTAQTSQTTQTTQQTSQTTQTTQQTTQTTQQTSQTTQAPQTTQTIQTTQQPQQSTSTSSAPTPTTMTTSSSQQSSSSGQMMRRQATLATMPPPNANDTACGPLIVSAAVTALNYVGAVEVAFAIIQLVGFFTGIALAIWILVQASKQKFNRVDEEDMGTKFAKQDYTASTHKDDEEDDGMSDPVPHSQGESGKKKIVVNFDH